MSVISSGQKIELGPWIRHFEDQAKGGVSARAFVNRHYIVVTPGGDVPTATSCGKSLADSLPPVVAPVEQGIEQAEAEVKREKVVQEKDLFVRDLGISALGSVCKKQKLGVPRTKLKKQCRKQRLVPRDIFS